MLRCLAVIVALALPGPVLAQDQGFDDPVLSALSARVAAYVQPTNAARFEVLVAQLEAAGLPYRVQPFDGGNAATGPVTGRNVIVTLGDGPRALLLTAHYDAVALGDGSLSHGVIDNAASVVALIDTARALRDTALNHTVQIVFFDQEELGLIGSGYFVRHGEMFDFERADAVVNADVAAFGNAIMHSDSRARIMVPLLEAVRLTCAELARPCVGFQNYPPSDDRAFGGLDLPTVSIGSQSREGAYLMWLAMNGDFDAVAPSPLGADFVPEVFSLIHSGRDVMAAVDPVSVDANSRFLTALILRLDRADLTPPEID